MNDSTLRADLRSLPPELRRTLLTAHFDEEHLVRLSEGLKRAKGADTGQKTEERNRVRTARVPAAEDLLTLPSEGSPEAARLKERGLQAIAEGKLAFCVMAGGMATRMGGVVKALVEAAHGKTFLELRLAENATWSARAKRPVPLWLMTSDATNSGIREALDAHNAPAHVQTFVQNASLRLTRDGELFRNDDGTPSVYATGHGDLPDALNRSGYVREFVKGGGEYVWIANLDNLGATVDPTLLGAFIARGSEVMVEVCDKEAGDRGGIPVFAEAPKGERLQILEEFRLPAGFDGSLVRVFNTNTFIVKASTIENATFPWTYFEVEKTVDGRKAVQFERLLQELTAYFDSSYMRVSRTGLSSRFLPVKDHEDLAKRRDAIIAIARDRGML